jgi:hypothetical protein
MPIFGIVPKFLDKPYIKISYESNEVDPMFMNGLFADFERYEHILIPEDIEPACATVMKESDTNIFRVVLDIDKQHKKNEEEWKKIREKRNKLLGESDKFMLPDFPIDSAKRELIANYRFQLRTLPETSINPFTIVFPEFPSIN